MAHSAGFWSTVAFLSLPFLTIVSCQAPSSFPHSYPGIPNGDFSPVWQNYFQVTQPLPNVTFAAESGRMFAGNIPVQRQGHPNDTLFFIGVEKSNGSLTEKNDDNSEPWGIWLNGGPGSSSMFGMFFENGPIRINANYSLSPNPHSWDKVADYFWIDQPVGVGFSTADANGYALDEEQVGHDFMGFLGNLVKVFPGLAKRPLYITGESYAGTYIPYILKAYFGMSNPPVNIAKIAIGDGTMASGVVFELVPALTVIETYPQLIGYDQDVFNYFKEQSQLCGFDITLSYPGRGIIPPVKFVPPTQRDVPFYLTASRFRKLASLKAFQTRAVVDGQSPYKRDLHGGKHLGKRNLAGRANGTIDPWYGCVLLDEYLDYAINFTFPWDASGFSNTFDFNVYDIPDSPIFPSINADASVFLNDARTRAALHAPTSMNWTLNSNFPFGAASDGSPNNDPSPEPMTFFTELATNATKHGVGFVLFSGNDDALVSHRGTEIVIQNTTFGGIQGFTRKPSTPWFNDNGEFAGIVHQERGWTYVLFDHAGHLVSASNPVSAFTFAKEFLFGSNTTGLVSPSGSVVGGEDPKLAGDFLPGNTALYLGAGATQSTYTFPSATVAAWNKFIQTASPVHSTTDLSNNSASRNYAVSPLIAVAFVLGWTLF
ncbi:hypothetical protein M378DRAFT_98802 [Amanita muscaria Koide BX008]|uniref:Carboxypeptidase n=1 Tax=Amanita muscaria (strain Koide BX008) TaxID=946122 RepID=A0A0C2X4Z9_AMAMK|nr:hypothetical protein M378DRAFT_98802 [Amanita muscaria Koide BX008]